MCKIVLSAMASLLLLTLPAASEPRKNEKARPALLARGDYLVNVIGACGNCHTPKAQGQPDLSRQLSGGSQTFDEPWFRAKGSNLTPDRQTGLGGWSDADIKRAVREGVRPTGVPIAPIMPFPFYRAMRPGDLNAVVAYLRSVPAVRNEVQTPEYKKEIYKVSYPDAARPFTAKDISRPARYGAYLAALGHCMACHSRRSTEEPPDFKAAWGAGGREFVTPAAKSIAANITSHKVKGLGDWTDAEIKRAMTDGVSRDGRQLKPPMADYVPYWRKLKPQDLDALVAWMRTLPPVE